MKKTKTKAVTQAEKGAEALSAKPHLTPAQRAGQARETMKKRRRQFHYLHLALQAAIRILNAMDRRTIYRN